MEEPAAGPHDAREAGRRHLAAVDPVLRRLLDAHEPPPVEPDPRHFRTLIRAIISQQLSSAGARAIMGRVEALFPSDVGLHPAGLAARDAETLRALGLSRAKVAAVHDLAARALDGRLDLDLLPTLPDEDVIARLVAVRGIGRWTAEMFLIFALGRPDVWPVGDYGIRSAVRRAYALPELPEHRALTALAEPWRPHRTAAALLLWRSIDQRPPNPGGASGAAAAWP